MTAENQKLSEIKHSLFRKILRRVLVCFGTFFILVYIILSVYENLSFDIHEWKLSTGDKILFYKTRQGQHENLWHYLYRNHFRNIFWYGFRSGTNKFLKWEGLNGEHRTYLIDSASAGYENIALRFCERVDRGEDTYIVALVEISNSSYMDKDGRVQVDVNPVHAILNISSGEFYNEANLAKGQFELVKKKAIQQGISVTKIWPEMPMLIELIQWIQNGNCKEIAEEN